CLIIGLVLMLILATIFFYLIFGRLFYIAAILLSLSVVIYLVLGIVYYIPLFIPTIVLYIFQLKTKELLSKVKIEKGEVSGLCLRALCCAIIITLLTALIPAVI
ncbi:hypothetical protein V2W45_1240446, partial [Cenococcum geophilum]